MKHHYNDIVKRLGPPKWWDENGTPRYDEFQPRSSSDVYARQIALCEIACQACGHRFNVCMSSGPLDHDGLWRAIADNRLRYGDPPNYGCCATGPTMGSVMMKVLQFWFFDNKDYSFKRNPEFERVLTELEFDPAEGTGSVPPQESPAASNAPSA